MQRPAVCTYCGTRLLRMRRHKLRQMQKLKLKQRLRPWRKLKHRLRQSKLPKKLQSKSLGQIQMTHKVVVISLVKTRAQRIKSKLLLVKLTLQMEAVTTRTKAATIRAPTQHHLQP